MAEKYNIDKIKADLISTIGKNRKRAAKTIARFNLHELGGDLFETLKNEISSNPVSTNIKNYEVIYEMIIALGKLKYMPARDYIESLRKIKFEASVIYWAMKLSMIRFNRKDLNDVDYFIKSLQERGTQDIYDMSDPCAAALEIIQEDYVIPGKADQKNIINLIINQSNKPYPSRAFLRDTDVTDLSLRFVPIILRWDFEIVKSLLMLILDGGQDKVNPELSKRILHLGIISDSLLKKLLA